MIEVENIGSAPVVVTGLSADQWYAFQNTGDIPVYVAELSEAPTNPGRGDGMEALPGNSQHRRVRERDLRERGAVQVRRSSTTNIYAWCVDGEGSMIGSAV